MNKQILKNAVFVCLFALPLVPFLVSGSFFFPFIAPKAFAFRIMVEAAFAAWLLLALVEPAYRPKRSPILYSIIAFLAVIGLADLLGAAPVKSFWSNFERMEGYVTLLHLGALFAVMSSVFREENWKAWWNTSLVASAIMAFYAFLQVVGSIEPNQAGNRVDGTFGNTIYLAVYMLFHIFVALFYMWRSWANSGLRWAYGLLVLSQTFILYHTATRGAILGLLGGLFIMAALNLFNRDEGAKTVRKLSAGFLLALAVLVGSFFAFRNAGFVNDNPVLSRFSSLTTEEIRTQGRYFIWPIAFEGWKEKPLLGWGQENFIYVFQKHYVPEMYRLEPWFDRAHNIFLDWMVAGGTFGILSYLSLYVSLIYLVWRKDGRLSYAEKSILTGLVAAYFFHNFFVFDHLMSYVLFFALLAYVHSRNVVSEPSGNTKRIPASDVHTAFNLALPAAAVALIAVVYFVNIQPMAAGTRLIRALTALHRSVPESALAAEYFEKAHGSSRLGRIEVTEQMALRSVAVLSDESLSIQERNDYFGFMSRAVRNYASDFSTDSRTQLLAGRFFAATGFPDEALSYLEEARELIPGKPDVYVEFANAYLVKGDREAAIETLLRFKEISPAHAEAVDEYVIRIQEM